MKKNENELLRSKSQSIKQYEGTEKSEGKDLLN